MNGYTMPPASTTTSIATGPDFSSPIRRPSSPQKTGDGGSLGVYTHAASPLRKAASANYLRAGEGKDDGRKRREGSPLKRTSTPGNFREEQGYDGRRMLHSRREARRESGYF